MKKIKKIYIIIFFILIIILSYILYLGFNKNNIEIKENNTKEIISENEKYSIKNGPEYLSQGDYTKIIDSYKNIKKLNNKDKILLATSLLQYGNYFYKENKYSKKAIELLDTIEKKDSEYFYLKGYSYEIIKNYTKALINYNKGVEYLNKGNKKDKNSIHSKSRLLNQIGHLYDLKGDLEKAKQYYLESYLIESNYNNSFNLARVYIREGDNEKAEEYAKYSLEIDDDNLKSEINYFLNQLKKYSNTEESIEYAKKSIILNPDYPMGYVGLAESLLIQNNKNYSEIEKNLAKAIELNPNGYKAYTITAKLFFEKGDIESALFLLEKAIEVTKVDIILMYSEREQTVNNIKLLGDYFTILENIKKDDKLNTDLITEMLKDKNFGFLLESEFKRNNFGFFQKYSKNKKLREIINNTLTK